MTIKVQNILNPKEGVLLDQSLKLSAEIFSTDAVETRSRLEGKKDVLLTIATDDDRVVGFKLGYAESKTKFYSWLGGVSEECRNQGVATRLLDEQHAWCKERGYQVVRTKTKNKWRSMLILNIKNGFDVIGTYTDGKGEPKIILEKTIKV